ncbi:hypothetical protein J3E68DRAFT_405538 [Trichoderma sp. SZMC 28012]
MAVFSSLLHSSPTPTPRQRFISAQRISLITSLLTGLQTSRKAVNFSSSRELHYIIACRLRLTHQVQRKSIP